MSSSQSKLNSRKWTDTSAHYFWPSPSNKIDKVHNDWVGPTLLVFKMESQISFTTMTSIPSPNAIAFENCSLTTAFRELWTSICLRGKKQFWKTHNQIRSLCLNSWHFMPLKITCKMYATIVCKMYVKKMENRILCHHPPILKLCMFKRTVKHLLIPSYLSPLPQTQVHRHAGHTSLTNLNYISALTWLSPRSLFCPSK